MKKPRWTLYLSKARIFLALTIIISLILVGMTPTINSILLENKNESFEEDYSKTNEGEIKTTGHEDDVYVYASFHWTPRYPDPGEEITFFSNSYASNGHITYERWQFDDGHTDLGHMTTHTFQKKGTYRVTLQVSACVFHGGNNWGMRTSYVTVGADPFPRITVTPEDPSPFEEVKLDASASSDPDGEITYYNWSYYEIKNPENVTQIGSEKVIYYRWQEQGTYNIILFIEDNKGNNNTFEKTIDISILKLNDFSTFSRGLHFNIRNGGNITAENVRWDVEINKFSRLGIRSRSLYQKSGSIYEINSNNSQTVWLKDIRRKFCKVKLTVSAEADNAVKISKSYYGLIFGKYIYLSERDFINPYTVILLFLLIMALIAAVSG